MGWTESLYIYIWVKSNDSSSLSLIYGIERVIISKEKRF